MISNKNRAKVQKYSDINRRLLFFCLYYLGEPARLWRHLRLADVETFHETSLRPVTSLSAAAPSGFPLQCFWLWGHLRPCRCDMTFRMTARRRHLHCQKHFHFNPSRDPRRHGRVQHVPTSAAGSQSRNRVSPLPGRFAPLGNIPPTEL